METPINVTTGETFTVPFGTGAGGFSFPSSGSLPNPPNTLSIAGPYHWWTVSGHNVYGPNLRLDQNPSINPTIIAGKYTIDIEGSVVCSGVPYTYSVGLFFDAGIVVATPQFPVGAILGVLAPLAALVGYVGFRKPAFLKF